MPSTRAQVEENSEELNLQFKQLVTASQGDQDSLIPKGTSSNISQLQGKDPSSSTCSSNQTIHFPANNQSWPTPASSYPGECSVLQAENSREERKFKQKVLGLNKAQEATSKLPATTAGTGEESTNEEFVGQARHRWTEDFIQPSRRHQCRQCLRTIVGLGQHEWSICPSTACPATSPASGHIAYLGQPDATTKEQI